MQPITTLPNSTFTTSNNQTYTTTIYPNDVTWEAVGKYVHVFRNCWKLKDGATSDDCPIDYFKSRTSIVYKEKEYTCPELQKKFGSYVQNVSELNKQTCTRSELVKDFEKQAYIYENYDTLQNVEILPAMISVLSGISAWAAVTGASVAACIVSSGSNTGDKSYALPIALAISGAMHAGIGIMSIIAAKESNSPEFMRDCYEYDVLHDMGLLAQNATGINYLADDL